MRAAGLLPRNVAVEFLEARLEEVARFGALAAELRQLGFLVVLDDVGAGHSNLDRIPLFRPHVIKVDRSLISGVRDDFYKQETLKSLVSLSRRIGALVVAEGIETEEEAISALELGADLLQGFFLSRPQPATAFDDGVRAASSVERLARNFKGHMVGEINERKRQHRRFNVIQNRMLCDLTNAQAAISTASWRSSSATSPRSSASTSSTRTACRSPRRSATGGHAAAGRRAVPAGAQGRRPFAEGVLLRACSTSSCRSTPPTRMCRWPAATCVAPSAHLSRRREQPALRALRRRQPVG